MPRPYSVDLRRRVVSAYENGEGTYVEIAERFGIGEATVDRWVSRDRRTGSVEPSAMGGDRHSKFTAEHDARLAAMVAEAPDATRAELAERVRQELGLVVSASGAVQRALVRLGVTRKKRRSTLPSGTLSG